MARFVTIEKFCELTGYTVDAVNSKRYRGDWLEGREYIKAPDRRIHINMEAYEAWLLGKAAFAPSAKAPSKSTSTTAARAAANA